VGLTPPSDLSADELAVWVTVCDEVDGSGSVELLRAWCASVVELRAGEAWLREHGSVLTLRDDKGNVRQVVQAPRYVQVRALRADLVRLADALRLSPRARGAVGGIAEVSATDDLRRRREARRSGSAEVPAQTTTAGDFAGLRLLQT